MNQITDIGVKSHTRLILENARRNLSAVKKSLRDLPRLSDEKSRSAIVISAGPSVHKQNSIKKILSSGYQGTIIAVDGAYIACLKAGLFPDFVLTLDPHPTRIVRWFGDPDFIKHSERDDYFARQDLDVEFRKNTIEQNKYHIQLVNQHGFRTRAIVSCSAPRNVVQRVEEARFDAYWWNPLVDDPRESESITRQLYNLNKLPCMNTGGTVGTAAWVFADAILKIPSIALVGMDLGYYTATPFTQTQMYYEMINHFGGKEGIEECFVHFTFPLTGEQFYTDPTYFWYRKNFLELLQKARSQTFNCTEGGTLFGENVKCISLDEFLNNKEARWQKS